MAVLTRDDYFSRLQTILGNDTSDEAIALMEDMTDTYNDLENRANGDGVDWEQRYKELDESWKQKYRHRFFSSNGTSAIGNPGERIQETEEDRAKKITIDDLFN